MKRTLITISLMIATAATMCAQHTPLWLRSNSISPDGNNIAFTYKGNIYIVGVNGGEAKQITSNPAYDTTPLWTPDGQNIVFCSTREGSKDIYKVSSKGGTPTRITTHPSNETLRTVLSDGTVIFAAAIQQDAEYGDWTGQVQLYATGQEGGRPQRITSLPVMNLSVNKDGQILYEDYKGYEDNFRKHHTSSVTRDIWLYTPANSQNSSGSKADKQDSKTGRTISINGEGTFQKLSTFKGEDRNPVFAADGKTFYYLSEQDGTYNIYRCNINKPEESVQLTFHKGNPVRYLNISENGTLCYSYDGELYTLKEGGQPEKVKITITTDKIEREAMLEYLGSGATHLAISPNGKEIAVTARGDIFVTSIDHTTTARITNTACQERGITFSKDGRTIYYASERNGHWGIWQTSLSDDDDKYFTYAVKTEEKMLTKAGETCFQPQVSPDGEWIAYLKNRTGISIMNLKSGKEKEVLPANINYSYSDGDQSYAWGPDSKHILCNYQADGGWNNEDVAVIDIETGEITDLTRSGYSDGGFRWALKGKAMTWASDKNGYRSHGSWGAERDIYLMFFDRKAYLEFNMNKEEKEMMQLFKSEKEAKKEEKKEKKDSVKTEKKAEKLQLDLEDRDNMIIRLTPSSGRMGDHYLTQDGKKLYYMTRLEKGMDLCVMDMETRSVKVLSKGVYGSLYPSSDDKYMFLLSGSGVSRISTADGSKKSINFVQEFEYKPAQEREYIFEHIWKQVNEKFYVADIHGIDWKGYHDTYAKFLPHIDNNFDFQEMLSELLGELNGSHTGARYYASSHAIYTFGALFDESYKGDGLKIKEVLKGGTLYVQDPEIKAGDIIEAINGQKITAEMDWYGLLKRKIGQKVVLTVKKGGKKASDIYVKPAFSDNGLMYKRWVEQRAEMVKKLSNGRIGYVHVQGMDSESFRIVFSELLGKYRTCEAVIVDTRHNGGGWLHDDLVTLLSGQEYLRFEPRGQYIGSDPYNKWNKPSCVLIGEDNYSDACGFPYAYKTLGIGKLIGTPVPGTMTAVWWETQIDDSIVFGIPQVAVEAVKEGRYIENMQIEPDILVYNDPASVLRGEDKQLEAAVAEMLKQIDNK